MAEVLLGTMTFGDTVSREDAAIMVDSALDLGVTHIDTANVYSAGQAESILASILAGRRDQVTLATKVGMPHEDAGDNGPLSPAAIKSCVNASLARLETDRVDLLYLHQPDRSTPINETLGAIADLQQEGKVTNFGLSNFSSWMTVEIVHAAQAAGMAAPVIGQQLLNLVARRLEEEYVEMAATLGISTAAYNPLSGGLLTGQHSFADRPETGRFGDSRLAPMYQTRYWSPEIFAAIDSYSDIAHDSGMSLTELALRWTGGHEGVDAVLIGASKTEHILANIEMLRKGPLEADVIAAIGEVGDRLRGPMPAYHR